MLVLIVRRDMVRALGVVMVVAVSVLPRYAAAGPDGARAHALALFADSDKAYKAGDFERAAALLEQAYALAPEPVLLFNLGRALEHTDKQKAIDAYQRYLDSGPAIDDRAAIEERIASLQMSLAPPPPPPEVHDPAPPPAEVPQPALRRWPLITLGAGAATIVTAALFGKAARDRHDDAVAAPGQVDAQAFQDSAHTDATMSNVLFVAGTTALAVGATYLVLDLRRPTTHASTNVVVRVGPGSVAVGWSWR